MSLSEVRKKIDAVDKQMKELFIERMGLSEQVIQAKVESGDVIYKPDREISMVAEQSADMAPEIQKQYRAFLKKIIEVSKEYQYGRYLELKKELDFTWSEKPVKIKRAGALKSQLYICNIISKDEVKTVDSWEELMTMIETGVVDAGVGIIETVGDDVYGDLYKMIAKYNLFINRSELVRDGDKIRKVVVFSKTLEVLPTDKYIKIMFMCHFHAGKLAGALSVIGDYGIRMTKIHSLPDDENYNNYLFFAEIEANLLNHDALAMVTQLSKETKYFQLIGSY